MTPPIREERFDEVVDGQIPDTTNKPSTATHVRAAASKEPTSAGRAVGATRRDGVVACAWVVSG
jgi:hypothetical protein